MSRESSLAFTYQDYLLLPEDRRYEIIGGDLFMTPAPGTYHQRISSRLEFFLYRHVQERGLGEVLHAPCDLVLSETDVVQPDIFFIAKDRLGIVGEKYVFAAPDLVVEILSEATAKRDRTIKAELYARTGVRELWIVDQWARTVEVLRGAGEEFEREALFAEDQTLTTSGQPGLEIPLREIF